MPRYHLQKYNGHQSRYRCPQCNHRHKTFALYIDAETNQPLASHVGKCDRIDKCGYHYTPKMWFADARLDRGVILSLSKDSGKASPPWFDRLTMTAPPPSVIPEKLFVASLKHYNGNHLISFLTNILGHGATHLLIKRYHIGTAKYWPGATVFWQIDIKGKVRSGKIMLYDKATGKRVKQPFNYITWVHKLLQLDNFNLQQCFFGEHLLKDNNMPIAIVESEKTALIASALLPKMIWLATGSLSNLSAQKCDVLRGRQVCLFPDLNALEAWRVRSEQLNYIVDFKVSTLLQFCADAQSKAHGFDIADYLIATIGRIKS